MSISQIGRAAGKAQSTISSVLTGPYATVNRATAEAILRVRPVFKDPIGVADATGSIRRVRGLYALGHSRARIASISGLNPDTISALAFGRWARVTESTAAAVRRAYDELSMSLGSSSRTRGVAQRLGWVPPLAWDEDTIDDPAAKPYRPKQKAPAVVDEAAVIRALSGERIGLSPAERTAAVERGVRQGLDYETVADILGSSVETVQRTWERRKAAGRARGEAWAGQAQMTKAA